MRSTRPYAQALGSSARRGCSRLALRSLGKRSGGFAIDWVGKRFHKSKSGTGVGAMRVCNFRGGLRITVDVVMAHGNPLLKYSISIR